MQHESELCDECHMASTQRHKEWCMRFARATNAEESAIAWCKFELR